MTAPTTELETVHRRKAIVIPPVPASIERRVTEKVALERVYVWDLVVRATHWTIALSIAVLALTGLYIGSPFSIVSGEAGRHFTMGMIKGVHHYSAIVFSLAVLSRIVWMFIGPPNARWKMFIPTQRARLKNAIGSASFYLFAKSRPPYVEGHNALAGLAYAAVFGLYLVMIATGLGLYAIDAPVDSPMRFFEALNSLFGGAQLARYFHHVVIWLLLGFAVHHMYSAALVAFVEKNGTIDSIISGFKWLESARPAPGQRRPRSIETDASPTRGSEQSPATHR